MDLLAPATLRGNWTDTHSAVDGMCTLVKLMGESESENALVESKLTDKAAAACETTGSWLSRFEGTVSLTRLPSRVLRRFKKTQNSGLASVRERVRIEQASPWRFESSDSRTRAWKRMTSLHSRGRANRSRN